MLWVGKNDISQNAVAFLVVRYAQFFITERIVDTL